MNFPRTERLGVSCVLVSFYELVAETDKPLTTFQRMVDQGWYYDSQTGILSWITDREVCA